ncbi:MAG: hypothetical protein ACXWDO_08175 [Bacteroidia bacterium]
MIKEELKYFLKTGNFKNIRFGLNRTELVNLLGNSDWLYFTSDKDKFPAIYKYGRIEFYFENRKKGSTLSGIMFLPIPAPASNGKLYCNYHHWTKRMDIDNAITFLNQNNIRFSEIINPDPEVREFITEGQVNIFFDCQEIPGKFKLHKAGKFI